MSGDIQIRARTNGSDTAEVKVLIAHPMETGTRKNPSTKELIPAHYITEVTAKLNTTVVLTAQWAGGIAKNPFMGFRVKGAKPGDYIFVSAVDNKGARFEHNAIVI